MFFLKISARPLSRQRMVQVWNLCTVLCDFCSFFSSLLLHFSAPLFKFTRILEDGYSVQECRRMFNRRSMEVSTTLPCRFYNPANSTVGLEGIAHQRRVFLSRKYKLPFNDFFRFTYIVRVKFHDRLSEYEIECEGEAMGDTKRAMDSAASQAIAYLQQEVLGRI